MNIRNELFNVVVVVIVGGMIVGTGQKQNMKMVVIGAVDACTQSATNCLPYTF